MLNKQQIVQENLIKPLDISPLCILQSIQCSLRKRIANPFLNLYQEMQYHVTYLRQEVKCQLSIPWQHEYNMHLQVHIGSKAQSTAQRLVHAAPRCWRINLPGAREPSVSCVLGF